MTHESKTDWKRVDTLTDEEIARGIAADPDSAQEWTAEDFERARPASEVLPQLVDEYRKSRGPQKAPTKVQISMRLSPEVVDYFKAQGRGWQTRINEVLVDYVTDQQ